MKTYTVLFAQDVPHYGSVEIQAPDDATALTEAQAFWDRVQSGDQPDPANDPDWNSSVCHRIVEITDDLKQVAHDFGLDGFHLRSGGDADRALCDAAPELLRGLDTATQILKRIAEALHYENGLPVTFLEAREIQDLYADAIGQTDELDAILKRARGQK